MPKKTKRTDLSALVEKYQGLSIVSEIERNLLSANRAKYPIQKLFLSDLFEEKNYHLDQYEGLKSSLKQDGFLVPLIVSKRKDSNYEILNGVKRFLLGKECGFLEIPCVLADLSEERKHAYIIENIIQEGDNPLIKTHAFLTLKNKYHYTDEKISSIAKLSLTQVRNLERLDSLPSFLKEGILDFTLSYSEARSLLNLPFEKQKELYGKIQSGSLSVRDLEREKRTFLGNKRKRKVTLKKNKVTILFSSEEEAKKIFPQIIKSFSD